MKRDLRTYYSYFLTSSSWLMFLICLSIHTFSQTATAPGSGGLQCTFQNKQIEFESIAAISNVLKVFNPGPGNLRVKIKTVCPSGWKSVARADREYLVSVNDTTYIPVRLTGVSGQIRGGIKYNFSAIVSVVESGRMYNASFVAAKPKVTNIKMEVQPGSRLYLLNDKMEMPFTVELMNAGNEQQDLLLSLSKRGNELMLTDSTGKFLQKNYSQVFLKPQTDTVLPFGFKLFGQVRNQRRIDTYGYMFQDSEPSRHYRIYLKAEEPRPGVNIGASGGRGGGQIGKTIDVLKLSSKSRVSERDGDVVPLTVIANAAQLFNQQPMINLAMNGRKMLNETAFLTYVFQNTYSYYSAGRRAFSAAFGQVGYFHHKGSLQIGSGVQLNLPMIRNIGSTGPGLAGTYLVKPDHRIGFSYSNNRGEIGEASRANYNLGYSGKFRKVTTGIGLALLNASPEFRAQIITTGVSLPLPKKQFIGLRVSLENYTKNAQRRTGYFVSFNYNLEYLKNKANTTLQATYRKLPNFFTGNDTINNTPFFTGNIFNTFRVDPRFTITSQHVYFNNPVYSKTSNSYLKNFMFSNLFFLNVKKGGRYPIIPAVYINYSELYNLRLLSEGLQLNVNRANLDQNLRIGFTIKGGLNTILGNAVQGRFFTAQVNSFITVKTWIFNARYFYGPQSQYELQSALSRQMKYSQTLFMSAGNQYQFKNKHFVMENTVSYNYAYVNLRQTASLFSQFFYYARNSWRFNLNLSINFHSAENIRFIYDPAAKNKYQTENGSTKQRGREFQFGVGVKKDFGIPLPKKLVKRRFATTQFKVFMDVNGNRKYDLEETKLENVIIRLNEFEAQTDLNGEAIFENVPLNKYKLQIQALDKIGAWFPLMSDSVFIDGSGVIYVPFSRGAQILGNVELSREKFSAGLLENIDISRIKIFVIDSAGRTQTTLTDRQGAFSFYLPYGSYTLRLDESVLGSQFELAQNDILVQLQGGMETFYQTFFISEKKRRVKTKKFNASGNLIEDTGNPIPIDGGKQN